MQSNPGCIFTFHSSQRAISLAFLAMEIEDYMIIITEVDVKLLDQRSFVEAEQEPSKN